MKKIVIGIIIIVVLIFLSDRIYTMYSRSNVNTHEAIVLINNQLESNDVDAFFNLEEGTFNPDKHIILFSLLKNEGYLLDYYINLPVKNNNGQINNASFECDIDYESVRPYCFYNYEIGNKNIIIRIIEKEVNTIKELNSNQIIAQKYLEQDYQFGKINIFDINKNGVSKHCN